MRKRGAIPQYLEPDCASYLLVEVLYSCGGWRKERKGKKEIVSSSRSMICKA